MSDAPETIWAQDAEPSECNFIGGGWWDETIGNTQYPHMVEYRRADLPATDAQAFANEKVKALVEALRKTVKALDEITDDDWMGEIDHHAVMLTLHKARAALAAMKETGE